MPLQANNNLFIELHKLIDNEVNHILPFKLEQYYADKITSASELRQLIREEVKDLLARENEVKSKKIEQEINKKSSSPLISPGTISMTPMNIFSGPYAMNIFSGPYAMNMPPMTMVTSERVKCARHGCKEMKAKREVRGTVFLNDSVYMNVIVYLCDKCFADCESTGKPDYPGSTTNCMEKK